MRADVLEASEPLRTFRDPAGSVEIRPDGVYRFVTPPFDVDLLEFLSSPLASSLTEDGRLISSEVVPSGEMVPSGEVPYVSPAELDRGRPEGERLVLRHPRVWFPSAPWEWSPSLWLAAAELTLSLCQDLLAEGWILKDATPSTCSSEVPHLYWSMFSRSPA